MSEGQPVLKKALLPNGGWLVWYLNSQSPLRSVGCTCRCTMSAGQPIAEADKGRGCDAEESLQMLSLHRRSKSLLSIGGCTNHFCPRMQA